MWLPDLAIMSSQLPAPASTFAQAPLTHGQDLAAPPPAPRDPAAADTVAAAVLQLNVQKQTTEQTSFLWLQHIQNQCVHPVASIKT